MTGGSVPRPAGPAGGDVVARAGDDERVDLDEVAAHALGHVVEDLARGVDPADRGRQLRLDPAHVVHRRQRALDLGAQRAGVEPVAGRLGHQRAGAGERVGDLERRAAALLGVEDDEQLVAVDLAQLRRRGRAAAPRTARPRRRSRRRAAPSRRRARRPPCSSARTRSWPRTRSARAAGPRRRRRRRARRPCGRRCRAGRRPRRSRRRAPGRSRRRPRTPPPRTGGPWRSSARARRRPRPASRARPAA